MSRDDQIWQVTTPMSRGKQPLKTYRSLRIGDKAVQIENSPLAILMQLLLDNADRSNKFNMGISIPGKFVKTGMPSEVWMHILGFNLGLNTSDILGAAKQVGAYALCLYKPHMLTAKAPGLFPVITIDPNHVVEAVLHGDEAMLRNILKTNPDLLRIGEGIDFSGREFTKKKDTALTPLQAAIACGDFAPNKNSTGLFELIVKKLKQQYLDNWHTIVEEQTLELYTKSLCFYAKKQDEKIRDLIARKEAGEVIDDVLIRAAIQRKNAYDTALASNDLITIINAHTNPDPDPTKLETLDAQKDHVIQVDQALIDAIEAATDVEIQAVLNDPTIDSPLSNLIKQFRKEVDSICQSEIISNPQHLLKLFTLYDAFYTRVMNADPNWKKRELFWRHLVGYVQRYLPACDVQIFANPGLYYAVEDGAKNARSFDFKYGGSSIFPLSFDSNSGLGYKFAEGCRGGAQAVVVRWWGEVARVTKLMSSKNSKLSELVTQPKRACTRKPERSCVIS